MAQMINTLEKTEKIREEVKASAFSNMISLSFCCLKVFPAQILANESVLKLKRLDLSHNSLSEIPPSISILVGLKELWLQHNPLEVFPEGVCHLPKLELIDIAHTKIAELPTELAHLTKLYEMDWRFSPLADNLTKLGVDTNDILKLRKHLNNLNTRKHLELQLHEYLQGEHYIQDADKKGIKNMVHMLVMDVSNIFDDLEDMRQYVRRAGKFLPEKIEQVQYGGRTATESKQLFIEFKRDTDRARLAADVEIKLRGMYFDRIERSEVTTLLDSIYANVHLLEDVQFLVQYAPQVLPPAVQEATGERIWANILALQQDLNNKREASVNSLAGAIGQLYPEQEVAAVKEKARQVASYFQIERFATKKELTKLSQMTAECAKVFPPDFASADPEEIIKQAQVIIFQRG